MANLLTFVAALTAAHFVASSLRNWRDAIRLVPIGSVAPSIIRDYKTVPLCFIGGETVLTYCLTYIYGRVWISPKARKQAALCDRIVFLNRDRTCRYQRSPIEPGMLIQATVAEGENSRHIHRSARRCIIGNELVLAMLFPMQSGERYQTPVRCITVRARARSGHDRSDIVPTRVIEWEVIDPTGIGANVDTSLEHNTVPHSAFWLVSRDTYGEGDSARAQSGSRFYSYGTDRRRGFLSWCVMVIVKLSTLTAVVVAASIVSGNTKTDSTIQIVLAAVLIVLVFKFIWHMVEKEFPERLRVKAPNERQRVRVLWMWTATVYRELEWHGSTRRSLAVGNRIRRVGFWQQLYFMCWEPLIDWLRREDVTDDE